MLSESLRADDAVSFLYDLPSRASTSSSTGAAALAAAAGAAAPPAAAAGAAPVKYQVRNCFLETICRMEETS
jgi:hypothetical protein